MTGIIRTSNDGASICTVSDQYNQEFLLQNSLLLGQQQITKTPLLQVSQRETKYNKYKTTSMRKKHLGRLVNSWHETTAGQMTYTRQDACLETNHSRSNDLYLAWCMWRQTAVVHMTYTWQEHTFKDKP